MPLLQQTVPHYFQLLQDLTPEEEKTSSILTALGIPHESQKPFLLGEQLRIVDIYIPHLDLAIELDGLLHFLPAGLNDDMLRHHEFYVYAPAMRFLRFKDEAVWRETYPQILHDVLCGLLPRGFVRTTPWGDGTKLKLGNRTRRSIRAIKKVGPAPDRIHPRKPERMAYYSLRENRMVTGEFRGSM